MVKKVRILCSGLDPHRPSLRTPEDSRETVKNLRVSRAALEPLREIIGQEIRNMEDTEKPWSEDFKTTLNALRDLMSQF